MKPAGAVKIEAKPTLSRKPAENVPASQLRGLDMHE